MASRVQSGDDERGRSAETIPLVGGHPAVDFVNTCEWHDTDAPVEYLLEYKDFLAWARRVGVLPHETLARIARFADAHANKAQAALSSTLDLRELLYEVFRHRIADARMTTRLIATLNRKFQDAARNARLVAPDGGIPVLHFKGETLSILPRSIVILAMQFLSAPGAARLRMCERPGCGWLFLDHSRKINRRWCSMQDCGNAMKQARFRDSRS